MTDRDAIALTVFGESRGEGFVGRLAVACVLRNRVHSGRWGHAYVDVCLARQQFSCWNEHDPNRPLLESLVGRPVTNSILAECYTLADVLLNEQTIRQVGEAMHYYAASIPPPKWAASGELIASVGNHKFFRNVPA